MHQLPKGTNNLCYETELIGYWLRSIPSQQGGLSNQKWSTEDSLEGLLCLWTEVQSKTSTNKHSKP
jgi:hypothetical protein